MTIPTTWAVDATHTNVPNIPAETPVVFGYAAGTPDIQWTSADWGRFRQPKISVYEGQQPIPNLSLIQEVAVESKALTPAQAANFIAQRVVHGYEWTGVYGSDVNLAATAEATRALGNQIWIGHVVCRLADWNLNEEQAAALIGTQIHGMTCMAVQWASPTSNPHTLVPGSDTVTLAQAQIDLNVVDPRYPQYLATTHVLPRPPAPPLAALLVQPNLNVRAVHSSDSGKTWS